MINLLPLQNLRRARREYYMRLMALSGVALAMVLLSSAAFLIPSYLFARIERDAALATFERLKSALDEGAANDSRALSRTAELLEVANKDAARAVPQLREILRAQPGGVALSRVAFEVREQPQFSVSGVAQTREVLLAFRDTLRESETFENVELPIGSLAKAVDIEFSLTIVVKQDNP